MKEHLCEVLIYGPAVNCPTGECRVGTVDTPPHNCDSCRIGCLKPARFENPYFGQRNGCYGYARWLCAEHYDDAVEMQPDMDRWAELFDAEHGWKDDGDMGR
jgi:hypothetical protein